MLNQFSWQEFIIVLTVVAAIYYSAVGIIYYKAGIRNGFKKQNPTGPRHASVSHSQVMGKARAYAPGPHPDPSIQHVSSEELDFQTTNNNPDTNAPRPESDGVILSMRELMNEVKVLVKAARTDSIPQEECTSLFSALLTRYTNLKKAGYADTVSAMIHHELGNNLSFRFSLAQIERWWNDSNETT